MKKAEWDPLMQRIAMARHKMWCGANINPLGERTGPCGHESHKIEPNCKGPTAGDLGIARAIAIELWGKPEDEESTENSEDSPAN